MTMTFPEFVPDQSRAARTRNEVPRAAAPVPQGAYRRALKRVLDVALVLASAPVVLPLVLALAVVVRLDGGGAFYTQPRVGRGGRVFRIWKLRTMVPDAEARLRAMLATDPAAKEEWDSTQKLRNDPRITAAGSFLRRSSLDELPQLWNVLVGDMSLVGPRPMMPDQQALYPGEAYYLLRPGITGLWQTEGRNDTTFAARAGYDARYEARVTLVADLRILWRTVSVVLRGTGC
jgi:lipopolysaccharide/colanic/teichoic acid biosynthesis glycosyltransferase